MLDAGADVNAVNQDGERPADLMKDNLNLSAIKKAGWLVGCWALKPGSLLRNWEVELETCL